MITRLRSISELTTNSKQLTTNNVQQHKTPHSLLFYRFFQRLRQKVGIELDARQYRNFLHCLLLGSVRDKQGLLELCKTMWLTRPQFRPRFEEIFEEAYAELPRYWEHFATEARTVSLKANEPLAEKQPEPQPQPQPQPEPPSQPQPEPEPQPQPEPPPSTPNWQEVELLFDENGEGGAGVQKEERELPSQLETPFLFSEQKYLPFQQRRAKQSWRRLKQQSLRQPTDEVDVQATVRALARNGFFYELVFETRKVSRQHFVALLDHGGSMAPHHHLFGFFIQGLRESTHYTQIETYYFTNYPPYKVGASGLPEYRFFTNMEHTASVTLSSLLAGWEKNTVVLFLSDAGAAHDGMNPARVQVTMELLNRLESKVEHVLWFNPLPGHLWKGSAGAFFGGVVPMLECTEAGIQQAVGRIR